MIVLKGITWDHERGYSPLVYTSRAFSKLHPDIRIDWKKRTLKEYGDYPVEKLAQTYDLLLVDHPFMGEAAKQNILLDLEQYMDAEALAIRAQQELGVSHRCYRYGDKQLALSVDTAMVTAVYRPDLLSQLNMAPPKTFAEMCSFAKALPEGKKIASPLCPTDIWCTFLSLGAALAGADFITEERIHHEAACEALEKINTLRQLVDPRSLNWNPIQVQDNMTADDTIVYAPYVFQYINYAWQDQPYPLRYCASPLWPEAQTSGVLGGVGIAVSAASCHIQEALEYVKYVTDPAVQSGEYLFSGGQPGQKAAWLSAENNCMTGGFFSDTLDALEHAYLRPRFPGWNGFQEKAGDLLHDAFGKALPVTEIADALTQLFRRKFHTK